MATGAGMRELGRQRCWELLGTRGVGRLAFCDEGQPVVLPVDYAVVDGRDLVLRTGAGAKAAAAANRAPVAFQIDDLTPTRGAPWSVLCKGTSALLSLDESDDVLGLDLEPSAGTVGRDLFIRITITEVTGRRLDGFGTLGR